MRLFEMFEEKIDEVNMSPGALTDFAKTEFAQSMTAGFETEIIVPNIINKEDLEKLSKYPNDLKTKSYEQIYDFFMQANNTEAKVNAVIKALIKEQKSGKDSEERLRRIISGNDESFLRNFYEMMSDIKAKFRSLNWPYDINSSTNISKNITAEQLSQVIAKAIGMPVKYASGYHDVKRGNGYFILEPDSSIGQDEDHDNTLDENEAGLELVSPPMPLAQTFEYLDKVFTWAKKYKCRTDASTGFHMGISIPNQSSKNVDYLKFILFLGDEYVLSQFGREDNTYAQNMNTIISGNIPSDIELEKMFKSMRNGMNSKAAKILSNRLTDSDDKYVSVNIKNNYIEVRSAGGEDYIKNVDKIKLTLMRYVRAMGIAADPEAEKNEYAKKVYKLLDKNFSTHYKNNNMMSLFAKYSAKQITSNDLMAAIHKIRQEKASNKYWKKMNMKIPEPKQGQGTEYFIINSKGNLLQKLTALTRQDAELMAERWVAENPNPIYDYRVVLANSKLGQQAAAITAATTDKQGNRIPKKFRVYFTLNGETFSKTINTQSEDEAYDWMAVNLPKAKITDMRPMY